MLARILLAALLCAFGNGGGGMIGAGIATRAAGKPTARDYVQAGLIAILDGPTCEKLGVSTFDSLVGDLSLTLPNNAVFGDGALKIDRAQSYKATNISVSSPQFCSAFRNAAQARTLTVEVVYGMPSYGTSAGTGLAQNVRATIGPNGGYGWLCPMSATAVFVTSNTSGTGYYWVNVGVATTEHKHHLCATYAPNDIRADVALYMDGALLSSKLVPTSNVADGSVSFSSLTAVSNFCIGPRYGVATVDEIMCYRIYDRTLTAAEIAYNYNIDKRRFDLP